MKGNVKLLVWLKRRASFFWEQLQTQPFHEIELSIADKGVEHAFNYVRLTKKASKGACDVEKKA